jgi:16S rRNA (guanine1207-N2)-methyltransferase
MSPALDTLLLPFLKEELPVPARALFLEAEPHPAFKSWPNVVGWQPWKGLADAWTQAGFKRLEESEGTWPMVLLLPGKSKDETLALFAQAYDLLQDGGTMVVSMANTAGAPRFEKELSKVAGRIDSVSKNKCRAFSAVKSPQWDQETLSQWRKLGEERKAEGTDLITKAGVFSPDHIDSGSKFLADHLPGNLRGKVADLGAGWGYLSRVVLERCKGITKLDLYEADVRALGLARKNLPQTDAELRFLWHDATQPLDGIYHSIVTNPPFHAGQRQDIDLGIAFIRTAANAVRLGGTIYLVANRQLPYERELDALGLVWRKAAEDSTFKLLFAEKRS